MQIFYLKPSSQSFLGSGQVTFVMEPFNPLGIQEALNSCAGWHGNGGVLDLWGAAVDNCVGHNTNGYPDFDYWPTSYSTNHQQVYYKWLERSWLAGQRVLVQQCVNNETLGKFMNTPPYGLIPDLLKKLESRPDRVKKYSESYPSRDAATWISVGP